MNFLAWLVVVVAGVFIADRTCPSFEDHYLYIGEQVLHTSKRPSGFGELFVNILGSGVDTLQYTNCVLYRLAQFNIMTVCKYDDGRNKFNTYGVFDKIIVTSN